jgi:hypothetical protein
MIDKNDEFNWDIYKNGYTGATRLIPNCDIIGSDSKTKCFSREPYAQRSFDIYSGQNSKIFKKDLVKGECVPIKDITDVRAATMNIELAGGVSVLIDLNREKRFLQAFGHSDVSEFVAELSSREQINSFLAQNLQAYVIESSPALKVSIWQGYLMGIREEFMKQIETPSKAYTAKVIEANKGGFFVEVQGIEAFMPGSLAAPNKINDFQSYIGKEVIVMVEDFLQDMNSFIVSHKKYIEYILPQKIAEIDFKKHFTGNITGTSKYGIFIEFEGLLTGLLHVSKMKEETKQLFNASHFKPGMPFEFYVSEVTKDKRIICTEESPQDKLERVQKFILESSNKLLEAEIAAIMNFGIIVNVGEVAGLVPLREFKRNRMFINNFVVKDKLKVFFDEYRDEKLIFKLSDIH